jgi:pimeloyl-ACP methyl ester carboxylesterase
MELHMGLSGDTSMSSDRLSLAVTSLLRAGFAVGGRCAPAFATRAAVWLFTKPRRSRPRSDEEESLTRASSFFLPYKHGQLAVMEWGQGPAVLCVHGWSSRGLRFVGLVKPLTEAGYKVIAFDAPAHGRSSGSHVDLMDFADSVMAVAERSGPIDAVVAHSFGAAAALQALERGLKCRKVIFFSALNGLRGPLDYMAEKLGIPPPVLKRVKSAFEIRFGRSIESLEAVSIIPRLKLPPLLICHDAHDPLLPHHNALDVLRVWKDSCLVTTSTAWHGAIIDDPVVVKASTSFIQGRDCLELSAAQAGK